MIYEGQDNTSEITIGEANKSQDKSFVYCLMINVKYKQYIQQ